MQQPTPSELHVQDTFIKKITDSNHQVEHVASYSLWHSYQPHSPGALVEHGVNAHADFLLRTTQEFFFFKELDVTQPEVPL